MCVSLLLLCYLQIIVGITATTDYRNTYSRNTETLSQMTTTTTMLLTTAKLCLTKCICTEGAYASNGYISLSINCQGHKDIDSGDLSHQIDSMLSSDQWYDRLQWVYIANSPLTHVPRSICQLTTLGVLRLDNNQLTRLPDNCLTNLSNLETFTAYDNTIETLQDGVFDGLTKLQFLNLRRNRISSIGLSVFATASNLSSLSYIDLSENNLTSLDTWIFDRGLFRSFEQMVYIDISYNKISKFTNKMDRHFYGEHGLCSAQILYVWLDLAYNEIRYYDDMFINGWKMGIPDLLTCSPLCNNTNNMWLNATGNNFMCDCFNYQFYKALSVLGILRFRWGNMPCNLTDPITKNSSIVNGLQLEDFTLFSCKLTERCPPECVCVLRPANTTLHVYCSNKNITDLPLKLPELPDSRTKYKLDFSNNKLLRRLEYRDYFVNTSMLDVSNCSLDDISDWKKIIVEIPGKLDLANNLWDCSCDNTWMIDFFRSIEHRLTHKVVCYAPHRLQGKIIIQSSGNEFCVDPASVAASEATKRALITSLSSVAGVVVVLLSVGVILYRLRVKLYTRWKFHPFDRDECVGEDMDYDVFLSCSSNDELSHGNSIREQLVHRGYRVCYPPTDFLPGQLIAENIRNAVVRSKRTVCLLTENFCQSSYCMYEFEVALHHNIMVKRKKRLIVLMALDNPNDLYANDASDTATLRQYLHQYTYIDCRADDWIDNLLYALPLHGMDEAEQADQEMADFNDIDDTVLLQ